MTADFLGNGMGKGQGVQAGEGEVLFNKEQTAATPGWHCPLSPSEPGQTQTFSATTAEAEGKLKLDLNCWHPGIPHFHTGKALSCRNDTSDPHKGSGVFPSASPGTQTPKNPCVRACACAWQRETAEQPPFNHTPSSNCLEINLRNLSFPNPP